MADPPTYPDTDDDTGMGAAGRGSTTSMPRWVKVSLIVAIVLVVAFVVSFIAGVQHGPGLHTPIEHGP